MIRVSQTKLQLANSLKHLMKKVPFHNITVQNVADHCGVNRQTFYYHFKDMYDLLEWIYQNDIFSEFSELTSTNWQSVLLSTVKYAKKNKAFLRNTNRSLRKETVEKFLLPFIDRLFSIILDDAFEGIYIGQEEREFVLRFFTYGFVNVIIQWIGSGMQEDDCFLLSKVEILRNLLLSYPGEQADSLALCNSLKDLSHLGT